MRHRSGLLLPEGMADSKGHGSPAQSARCGATSCSTERQLGTSAKVVVNGQPDVADRAHRDARHGKGHTGRHGPTSTALFDEIVDQSRSRSHGHDGEDVHHAIAQVESQRKSGSAAATGAVLRRIGGIGPELERR
jgi:hypothetical protein